MTCKDCIHYVICQDIYKGELKCSEYKNKSEFVEVKHGRWFETDRFDHYKTPIYQCSVCLGEVADNYIILHKHCLHCGAEMEGVNDL